MSSIAVADSPRVFADVFISTNAAASTAAVVGGAALTAVMAQLAVPLWPVPITGQTLAVLLVGSTLGPVRGMLSMALYWVAGVAGVPVFSDASSGLAAAVGPTGGYLLGFIAAAGLTGWLAKRNWDKKFLGATASFFAGTVITFVFGMAWLSISLGADLQQTLEWGLYPFIIGGIVKSLIAAAVMPAAWKLAGKSRR
ncbi:MAG: biotin transporter BioY [Actinomycetota bacterium]